MPATQFVCPKTNGNIKIGDCLQHCMAGQRCMFLPTLRSVAASLDRKLDKPSVTELISGTRETFLKKTTDYAVDPMQQLYAIHTGFVTITNCQYENGKLVSYGQYPN